MCFDLDSSPPIPVISGGAPVLSEDVTLEAADGNRFAAFLSLPEEPGPAGVVILPDVRGLYRFYEELALRFAERGYPAVAIDYFGRTAGVGKRGDDFPYPDHVAQTTPQGFRRTHAQPSSSSGAPRAARARRSSPSASASAAGIRGFPRPAATGSQGRSASTVIPASGTASPVRRNERASSRRRSSGCRRATTRTSPRRTTRPSMRHSPRRASSTRSSPTTARRTASSTASTRSSPTPR